MGETSESTGDNLTKRVGKFLQEHAPFDALDADACEEIARDSLTAYCAQGELLKPHPHAFYAVVKKGLIALTDSHEKELDLYDAGDLILPPQEGQKLVAREESLIYCWEEEDFAPHIATYPALADFINLSPTTGLTATAIEHSQLEWATTQVPIQPKRSLISTSPRAPITEALELFDRHDIGSVIVINEQQHPVGIVTDSDLRRHLWTKGKSPELPIGEIMSGPVVCIAPGTPLFEAQLMLMRHDIDHLCFTEEGSNQSPALGIITGHDLLVEQGQHPAALVKEIRQNRSPHQLAAILESAERLARHYLQAGTPCFSVGHMMSEICDALTATCLQSAWEEVVAEGHPVPTTSYCWMALGSQGRQEQIWSTDQDTALVYAEPLEGEKENTRHFFQQLGQKTTAKLHACGYALCPGGIMASNPNYCLSLEEWKATFAHWITHPDPESILQATIFFDLRAVAGDAQLVSALQKDISTHLHKENAFLPYFAKHVTTFPPPLSFFRHFVLEAHGEHRDSFDLKLRALAPLCHVARLLALEIGHWSSSHTGARYQAIARTHPDLAELARDAAHAYEAILAYRAKAALAQKDSGRYLDLTALNKWDRKILKESFALIKRWQNTISLRYQLDYLRD